MGSGSSLSQSRDEHSRKYVGSFSSFLEGGDVMIKDKGKLVVNKAKVFTFKPAIQTKPNLKEEKTYKVPRMAAHKNNILSNTLTTDERMKLRFVISRDIVTDFLLFLKTYHIGLFENMGGDEEQLSILHYAMQMGSFKILLVSLCSILKNPLTTRELALLAQENSQKKVFIQLSRAPADFERFKSLLDELGISLKETKHKNGPSSFIIRAEKDSINYPKVEEFLFSFKVQSKVTKSAIPFFEKTVIKSIFDGGVNYGESSSFAGSYSDRSGKQKDSMVWKRLHEIANCPSSSVTLFHTSSIKSISSHSKVIQSLFSSIKDRPDFIRSIFSALHNNFQGVYTIILYGTTKEKITVNDLFPVSRKNPNKLLCTSYESLEPPDITLPIIEKCLAKFYGSYENLYKKADILGECVLYSVLFGMSYEIINLGYSERKFGELMFALVSEFMCQSSIVKLRRLTQEKSKTPKEAFVPYDTDYNVIQTFPSKHVQMALIWDWEQANNPKVLMDKLEFGTSSFMWKIEEFVEEFCYSEDIFSDQHYFLTGEELSLNFDQVVVMYNIFPRHHRTFILNPKKMVKGNFFEIKIDFFLEIHIEMIQETIGGTMNMAMYKVEGTQIVEIGSISPKKGKLRQAMRFSNNSLVCTLSPGLYLLRFTFKTDKEPTEIQSFWTPPTVRITSSRKIKEVVEIEEENYQQKFLKMYFSLILMTIESNLLNDSVILYKGPAQIDHRYFYVIIENKNQGGKEELTVRFFGFKNCFQSKTKSMMMVEEDKECFVVLEPGSTGTFVFKELDPEDVYPSVQVEPVKIEEGIDRKKTRKAKSLTTILF